MVFFPFLFIALLSVDLLLLKKKKFADSQIDHCLKGPAVLTTQTKDNYILNNKVFSNIKKRN